NLISSNAVMTTSSSRGISNSPFYRQRLSSPYSSTSSSSLKKGRSLPRSNSTSAMSLYGGSCGEGYGSRSMTAGQDRGDYPRSPAMVLPSGRRAHGPWIVVRERRIPFHEREYHRGDEVSGDKIVRNESMLIILNVEDHTEKRNDDISKAGSTITETTQAGELLVDEVTVSNHMDLLVEQVKILAGEIAFRTSTIKRLLQHKQNEEKPRDIGLHEVVLVIPWLTSEEGDQISPGIIPLAIKDVFSIIQD
ncbi:kinesin-related protein, partial [Striga asiatica]